jgi:hypothetical protein
LFCPSGAFAIFTLFAGCTFCGLNCFIFFKNPRTFWWARDGEAFVPHFGWKGHIERGSP